MWNHSSMFKCAPLFCNCNFCVVLWMGPNECVCSARCLAKLEEWLAVLNAFLCSWNHVAKLGQCAPRMPFHSWGMSTCTPLTVNVCLKSVACALTVFVQC